MTEEPNPSAQDIYSGGFIAGLLTARYYALRHPLNGEAFAARAPRELPDIVYMIIERLPRVTVDDALFAESWRALDHLLLCESLEELEVALIATPGLSFH